jgi:outer membrane protein OmpA-like peptidoglycan-associated protein
MSKSIFYFFIFGLSPNFFTPLLAQNLVENNSFETACETLPAAYKRCGNKSDITDFAPPWYCPQNTNPDLICNNLPYIPVNDTDKNFGKLKAADGSAYAGIGFNKNTGWVESIAIQLSKPLDPEKVYKISYKASYFNDFGKNGDAITENYLGVKFYMKTKSKTPKQTFDDLYALKASATSQKTKDSVDKVLSMPVNQNEKNNHFLCYTAPQNFKNNEWQTVEKIFTIGFAATHLSIGFFNTDKAASGYNTYFYIDDVVLEETTEKASQYEKMDKSKPIIVPNLFFDTGKSVLLPASFPELDKLAAALAAQTALNIEISGHTDNMGNATANQTLSEARANAVRTYLTSKGIVAARLTAKGYGSAKPLAPNTDAASKAKNRRVEVTVRD